MCRVRHLLAISLLVVGYSVGAVEFVHPPPQSADTGPYSNNAVYELGSTLDIEWTAGSANNTSLTMFQLNGTQWMEPFEYLTENISWSVTSLSWTVQTTKNLTFSPMFYLCLFIAGETVSEANSHFFNISNPETSSSSTTSSSTTTSSLTSTSVQLTLATTTITTTASTSPATSQTTLQPTPTASIIQPAETSTGGMSTGAKAGIGVGASVGALCLGFAGLFFMWRRRKANEPQKMAATNNEYFQNPQVGWESQQKYHGMHELSSANRPLPPELPTMPPAVYELPDSNNEKRT